MVLVGGALGVTGQRVELTTAAARFHPPDHIALDLLLRANCCPLVHFLHVTWATPMSKTLGRRPASLVPAPDLTTCLGSSQTIWVGWLPLPTSPGHVRASALWPGA